MTTDVISVILTRVLLCAAFLIHPTRATCPATWYAEGVRPTGTFTCRPVLGDPDRDLDDARGRVEIADPRAVTGQIYCTGGAHPVVVNSRTVGCQR